LRPDGTEVAIDDSAAPIHDPDGRLRGVVLVFRDIGERQRNLRR
jgi:PAS domain S-box-containing protein